MKSFIISQFKLTAKLALGVILVCTNNAFLCMLGVLYLIFVGLIFCADHDILDDEKQVR